MINKFGGGRHVGAMGAVGAPRWPYVDLFQYDSVDPEGYLTPNWWGYFDEKIMAPW